MAKLKKGDRVVIRLDRRPAFHGEITGEGRSGQWWLVRKDGTKTPTCYHKSFCRPEILPNTNGIRGGEK